MLIAPGGAVGIGTSSPNAMLDVRGSAGNPGFGIAADSSAWQARGPGGWVKAMAYVDPFTPEAFLSPAATTRKPPERQ